MKLRSFWAVILTLSLLVLGSTLVQAQWSALNSGYAVTTDYHGIPVWPLPQDVTATAGTTEHPDSSAHDDFPDVTGVRFRWMPPEGSGVSEWFSPPLSDPPKPLVWDGSTYFDGWPVYMATDIQTINIVGEWGVQAWFYDTGGNLRHQTGIEKIRATSFNAIPEVPFGTIAILLVMFGALGVFALKKKHRFPLRMPSQTRQYQTVFGTYNVESA